MLRLLLAYLVLSFSVTQVSAQTGDLQALLQTHQSAVAKASRKTIDPVLQALIDSKLPQVQDFLERWREKEVWQRKSDKLFFYAETDDKKTYRLIDMNDNAVPFGASAEEIISRVTEEYNYPVAFNIPAGHLEDNQSLVLGGHYSLEVREDKSYLS